LRDYGEIPGGKNALKPLLYPFHKIYPLKFWSKYRWRKNSKLRNIIRTLSQKRNWLTVIDRLGAPGDALITANVIRNIKSEYPELKINCITPHPELLRHDPTIDSLNGNETFYSFDSTYWELIVEKDQKENIISHNLMRLGIKEYEYSSKFYLTEREKAWSNKLLDGNQKPIISICTKSKEPVKNWPIDYWTELIKCLTSKFTIIHLGDEKEPIFKNVIRYAGLHTMRESAALLSISKLFIGPDSLLMHIANGLKIKSIIIFGGSRPVECFGYEENINLSCSPACSPCWIHESHETCSYDLECMRAISVQQISSNVLKILEDCPS
jgi:ADP-heptose:LPS heptosyltransferase